MAGQPNILREYLSVKELSDYSGICVRTLRDMLNTSTNPIPAYRFGGSIKVKRSEFDEWAKSCRLDNNNVNKLVDEVLSDLGLGKKGGARKIRPKTSESSKEMNGRSSRR